MSAKSIRFILISVVAVCIFINQPIAASAVLPETHSVVALTGSASTSGDGVSGTTLMRTGEAQRGSVEKKATRSMNLHAGLQPKTAVLFIPNKGQANPSILWETSGPYYAASFYRDGFAIKTFAPKSDIGVEGVRSSGEHRKMDVTEQHISFVGANPNATVEALDEQQARFSFFRGNDANSWVQGAHSYARLRYRNIYPGIDLTFYGHDGVLEYDFSASPGSDPSLIQLRIDDKQALNISSSGELLIGEGSSATIHRPVMYQNIARGKRLIEGRFIARNRDTVQFAFEKYDKTKPFIIDPSVTLLYSTFLGGKADDEATAIAIDTAGDTYVYGYSFSEDFPVSANGYQSARSSVELYNLVLSKFDASGNMLFSTYLHGSGGDYACYVPSAPEVLDYLKTPRPCGMTLDAAGNAYLTGNTNSSNFPVTSDALQSTFQGSSDAFIAEISSDGSSLIYSTYIGGASGAAGSDLALVPGQRQLYFLGYAQPGFPTTPESYMPTLAAATNNYGIVIAKLDLTQTGEAQLVAATYYGTAKPQANGEVNGVVPFRIRLDSAGNVWVAGTAHTNGLPTTANAITTTMPLLGTSFGGPGAPVNSTGLLLQMPSDLSKLNYASYITGGTLTTDQPRYWNEFITGLALDGADNLYIAGATPSGSFPVTKNAVQGTYPGNGNLSGFLMKLSPDGTKILYSTYLGGSAGESLPYDIALDSSGNIWTAGTTGGGSNFPLSSDALQSTIAGGNDGFVTELSSDGSKIVYSTYLGGSGNDAVLGIRPDFQGNIHVDGYTNSANFPLSPNALQSNFANGEPIYGYNDEFFAILGGGVIGTFGPLVGGNTGDTTITVNGSGFQQGATCSLVEGNNSIASAAAVVSANGTSITCTFALNGAAIGSYSVLVNEPDGSSLTGNTPFTIEEGAGSSLWVNITGRPFVRFNTPSAVTISYGNAGDTDAVAVPLYITIPPGIGVSINTPLLEIPSPPNFDLTTLPDYYQLSDGSTVIPLLVSRIEGGAANSLQLSVTIPASIPNIEISASIFPPMFSDTASLTADLTASARIAQSTLKQYLSGISAEEIPGVSPGLACLKDAATQVYDVLPVKEAVECFKSTSETFIDVIDGVIKKPMGEDRVWSLGKLFVDIEQTLVNCSQAAVQADPYVIGLKYATQLAGYIADVHDLKETYTDCKAALTPAESANKGETGKGAIDPNDKSGPSGDGSPQAYIMGANPLSYNVAYENEPTATAPAGQVIITDQLDPAKVNINTVTLGPISFGATVITPPSSVSNFSTVYSINSSLSVRIQGSINPNNGLAKWTLTSIDPSTGLPPTDPTIGFLPPDTDGVKGQGSVIFNVQPMPGQATGTQITNMATVVFDSNAPINTPAWLNTLDVDKPTSNASAPESVIAAGGTASIPVTWTGTDKGSGIASYTIYVSDNGSAFTIWQSAVSTTSASYTGTVGHTYGFYSIATDGAGNIETAKTAADVTTQVTLNATTTRLTASISTPAPGQVVTFTATVTPPSGVTTVPTGTVTFLNSSISLGSAVLNASGVATIQISMLPSGTDSITAVYGGDNNFSPSTSPVVSVTVSAVSLEPTATMVTSSASTAGLGANITFTATVTSAAGTAKPTGTVTFSDGTNVLGSTVLNSSGMATYSTSTLAVGVHAITAQYSGDSQFSGSTSTAMTETINAPSFTLTAGPSTLTIVDGQSGTTAVTVTSMGGFSQQVSFACSGLPANAACSFSPSTVTPNGSGTVTSIMTITTDVASASLDTMPTQNQRSPSSGDPKVILALALAGMGFLFRIRSARLALRGGEQLRNRMWMLLLFIGLSLAMLTGCGGGNHSTSPAAPVTPAGTYKVSITASSGMQSQSTNVTVTVQ